MEKGKGSRWEIFHNIGFRAQRLSRAENRDGEQAICQSKQKEWRAFNSNEKNETKET